MNKQNNIEEKSKEKIREFEKDFLSKLSVYPRTYTYIKLYHILQELYFQGKYELVINICNLVLDDIITN